MRHAKVVVDVCEVCDRVQASFNTQLPDRQPLSIEGLFYHWGMDLCGPFPTTTRGTRGNTYVAIMIEHYSKTVVLEPLVHKDAKHSAMLMSMACCHGMAHALSY